MPWRRLDKITTLQNSNYYAKPLLLKNYFNGYTIFFTDRDKNNCSFIKRANFLLGTQSGHITNEQMVYQKDPSNPLEKNGVIATSILSNQTEIFLLCTAFHFDINKNFLSVPMLIILDKETYQMKTKTYLDLQNNCNNRGYEGYGAIIQHEDCSYLVFESRFVRNNKYSFKLKLAKSLDLFNWKTLDNFSINPNDNEDYLSSPNIIKYKEFFFLAYSLKKDNRYSIVFKKSIDLISWNSLPEMTFSPNQDSDWENEETCYPFLFINSNNELSMIYNGNKYGKTGIGYAVWN